jgi:predicted secreted hydrolase
MDHEFSTSSLSSDQIGWDWFSLQFDDGSELMVFQIRRADGSLDPFSSGTLIEPDGAITRLKKGDFQIEVLSTWKSPHSKASYPARWVISVPDIEMTLNLEPYQADQELNVSYAYWEGAVRIAGVRAGDPLYGSGYAELTGYSGSMGGEF